jgi:hypothetical protein
MLRKKISMNEAMADLADDTHRLLYTWALAHLDVDGKMDGRPRRFRAIVCPLLDHISADKIVEFFNDASNKGLLEWYTVGELKVIRYPKFAENQKLSQLQPPKGGGLKHGTPEGGSRG